MSKSARYLQKNNPVAYDDKLHAISNSDELLKIARNWIGEELKHNRKDSIVEFARGNIRYKVGDHGYIADVIVATKSNGAAVLYDIKNIYEKTITEANRVTKASENSLRTPYTSVRKSLSQSYEKSNTPDGKKSMDDTIADDREYMAAVERGDMETAQRMVDEAAKAAGYNTSKLYHITKSQQFIRWFGDWQNKPDIMLQQNLILIPN